MTRHDTVGPYAFTYIPRLTKRFAGVSLECDSDGWCLSAGVRNWRGLAVGWLYKPR
jgi:hypothetical protein